jgi:hypothetical protein
MYEDTRFEPCAKCKQSTPSCAPPLDRCQVCETPRPAAMRPRWVVGLGLRSGPLAWLLAQLAGLGSDPTAVWHGERCGGLTWWERERLQLFRQVHHGAPERVLAPS